MGSQVTVTNEATLEVPDLTLSRDSVRFLMTGGKVRKVDEKPPPPDPAPPGYEWTLQVKTELALV